MKRSTSIRLLLIGAVAGTTLAGCDSDPAYERSQLSADNTYTNNHYVHGAGYYHAPYRAWFPYPYNSFTPGRGYFHGGQWNSAPDPVPLQSSRPEPAAVRSAQALHDTTPRPSATHRSGFGSSSRFTGS